VHLGTKAGREVVVLPLITTNSGSLSARNILWNYDLPSSLTIVSPGAEHHEHASRTTIARALEHLHPQVEAHHEIVVEHTPDFGDFAVWYRIHLEDSRPIRGSMQIKMGELNIASTLIPPRTKR